MQKKKTLVQYESADHQEGELVRILLIEDEESAALLVQKYLAAVSFADPRLEVAATLKSALARLHANSFDILIADLNLPDSRGLDTLDALADGGHRLILVVSGEDHLRDAAIARGAYDFLAKQSLTKDTLQRLVRLGLVQAKANRSLRESEAKFRSLTALSSDTYWEQDAEHRFTSFSETGPAWIVEERARMLGKRRWEIGYFNMTPADWAAHKALLDGRRPFRDLELGRLNESGEAIWISTSGEPVFDATGAFKGYRGLGTDISARKRAEQSLKASEERFRSLTELSSDWYWEQDRDFRLTFMSASLGDKTGLRAQAYLGRRRWEQPALNLTEEDWARHRSQLERHEPFRNFEMQRAAEDGSSVWLSLSGEPVFDAEGRFAGYRGIGRDITVVKQEERLLRLEHYVALSLADAQDRDAGINFVLRAICESEGWKCARFFGVDEQAQVLRCEGGWSVPGEAFERFIERSREVQFTRGQGFTGTTWQSAKALWVDDASSDPRAATPFWREAGLRSAFLFPVMASGAILGVISISSDRIRKPDDRLLRAVQVIGSHLGQFLQRKRSEAEQREVEMRFRDTFELAGSGIAHVGLDGRFLRANRKLCEILGYAAEELIGRSVKEISHPEDRDVTDRPRARVHAGELDSVHFEKRYLHKDGRVVWIDLTVALARDAAGKPHYEISVMEDITARKRAEQLRALEHAVTRVLADAGSVPDVLRRAMQAICESEGWDSAGYFELDESAALMRFRESWSSELPAAQRYGEASRGFSYRRGEGLVGAAWECGEPLWVPDLTRDGRVAHREPALESGMRGALNLPVAFEGRTAGVIAITSREVREPDERLLQALRIIGSQIGQYVLRMRSEDAQRRFRAGLDASADMVFLVDVRDAKLLDFNATACRYLGYERSELLEAHAEMILAGPSREELLAAQRELLGKQGREDSLVRTYRRKDGTTFEAEVARRLIDTPEGRVLVVNARDLTERRRAELRQAAHARYQEKIARLGQAVLARREPAELIEDALQSTLEGLGADAVAYAERGPVEHELILRSLVGLTDKPGSATAKFAPQSAVAQVLASGLARLEEKGGALPFAWASDMASSAIIAVRGDTEPRGVLCVFSRRAGAFGAEEQKFVEAVASILSTGLRRIESEVRLAFLAQFDPLTGLPNRALLSDRFSQMIVQAARRGSVLGVLFIDLDDFKAVNDTLGHAGGDELLKEVARRLENCVRAGDTVARISGDEFAVILADLARAEDAALVAQKVIERFAIPVPVQGKEVFITASIGISAFPADGDNAEVLLGAADAAMYRAKQSGRNMYQFFTADINRRSRARAQLSFELRRALEREEFRLVYQPKFDLKSGAPCGAEALLRWQHAERGLVSPMEFIPVLEETGLIVPVGEWVVQRACADLKAWLAAGLNPLPIAVNLSARQFRQHDLDARISALVKAAGVEPSLIELEITESQLMHDPDHAIRVMRALREAGLRIAIDDFGTGYSSLAYLTRFPVASLKIDRSFVADINSDPSDAAIVRTIIDMAHTLGFTVVAEGVETQSQASFLRDFGCEQAQGYLFAKPMPAADFQALIQNSRPIPAST